jgi:hypothetical protein
VTFIDTAPKGLWNTYTGPQEDGPSAYLPRYAGLNQTAVISAVNPKPPTSQAPGGIPPTNPGGKIWTAAGVTQAQVQAAVNLAAPGDTVVIPAGTGTWTTPVVVGVHLIIVGAGSTQTVINNNTNNSSGLEVPLFQVTIGADKLMDISGLYLQSAGGATLYRCNGINMYGSTVLANQIKIHDCVFDSLSFAISNGQNGNPLGFGVCYNCTFINNRITTRNAGFYNQAALYSASIPSPAWGSTQYMCYEDNTIQFGNFGHYPQAGGWTGGPQGANLIADTEYPMNFMYRKNTFTVNRSGAVGVDAFDMHGSGNAQNPAAPASNNYGMVIRDNVWNYTGSSVGVKLADIRGGVGALIYNNIIHGQNGNYMQLRTDPAGSIAPAQAYTWNNTQDAGAIADPGSVGPPAGYTEMSYPHPLRS